MTYEMGKRRRNWRVSKEGNSPEKYHTPGFARVEKMFYYYPRILKGLEEMRDEMGYYQSGPKDGGGSSNHAFISDPTFQMASKHMQRIQKVVIHSDSFNDDVVIRPEDWVAVIEATFKKFPDNDIVGRILRKRYIANEPMPKTCIRYELTYSKYYRLRDIGINYARECAIQVGLIKIFDY